MFQKSNNRVWRSSRICATLFFVTGAVSSQTLDQAQAAERANNLPKAEAIYQSLIASHPSAELYQRLGLVRHLQNKFSSANDAFEHALRLDPKLWPAHLFAGIDLYRLNRFSDALPHLRRAAELNSKQKEIEYWLGATFIALHRELEGFVQLEKVLNEDPANTDALTLLAESYADYGTELLNQVAEKHPDSLGGLLVQAQALEFETANDAALQMYRKAAALAPDNAEAAAAIKRLAH